MPTDAIKKIDPYTIAQVAEAQNRERNRDRGSRRQSEKGKTAFAGEIPAVKTDPGAPELPAGQIIDSSTVVTLLAHQPKRPAHARFLARSPKRGSEERRKTDGKKLDKSA